MNGEQESILFPGEKLVLADTKTSISSDVPDDDVNSKYVKGDIRIITEQARYPLTAIAGMVAGDDYELNPEFQRRHRWDAKKQSLLIESFIMNVPIPPIFLYEDRYSHYEVMDGLQRLTAIHSFYTDKLVLEGLEEWPELNGLKYSELPDQVKRGVDRRYLSSIILLQETAKNEREAKQLKQLVFERINSGGVMLENQESRNAIYNGPLNQLCIKLSRNPYLCKTWRIPEPTQKEIKDNNTSSTLIKNDRYRKMVDVELVLRFFAYRQRLWYPEQRSLRKYLDRYLQYGNEFPKNTLDELERLFVETIKLVYDVFGADAFLPYRLRQGQNKWRRFGKPILTVYESMTYAFSQYVNRKDDILKEQQKFSIQLEPFYKKNLEHFTGRSIANISKIKDRNNLFMDLIKQVLGE